MRRRASGMHDPENVLCRLERGKMAAKNRLFWQPSFFLVYGRVPLDVVRIGQPFAGRDPQVGHFKVDFAGFHTIV